MRFVAAVLAGVLLLTACTGTAVTTPAPSGAPASTVATPSPSATPGATSTYTGPSALPASDGGPMLWPAPTQVTLGADDYLKTTRYGFVDTRGVLVVPPRYEGYEYCRDDAGRVTSLVVTAARRRAAVLDLTGAVVRTLPTGNGSCGPAGTVVFTRYHPMDDGRWEDGLMDVASGKVLLPLASKRHLALVDERTVNVSEPGGEYFFDTVTRRRSPHPGEVAESYLEQGAPGVPATVPTAHGGERIGYLATSGDWAIAPDFVDGYAFEQGFAVVELTGGGWTFLDVHGTRVGGEWGEIEEVSYEVPGGWRTVGYVVTGTGGRGVLDAGLKTVVEVRPGIVTCDSEQAGACSVVPEDGPALRVLLAQGTVTEMPDGYDQVLGASFVATGDDGSAVDAGTRVLAVDTGLVIDLGASYSCQAVDEVWATCTASEGTVAPPVVLDSQGRRPPFSAMTAIYGATRPAEVAWYWATTARYEGIVDATGTWHYRQSRFTRLED